MRDIPTLDGAPAVAAAVAPEANGGRTVQEYLKDLGLFFAAPFITLAYLAMFPFIGAALLLRNGRHGGARGSEGIGPN